MNLTQLKRIEHAHWSLLKVYDAMAKADPQNAEIKALREQANKQWSLWRNREKQAAVAHGEKKDKGEVLFTIFEPDGEALRTYTRTPNRMIRGWERKPWYLDREQAAANVQPARSRSDDWLWDFQYHMRTARENCDRARERKAKAA